MRYITALLVSALAVTGSAQEQRDSEVELAYAEVVQAMKNTRNHARFHLNVGIVTRVGQAAPSEYRLRVWYQRNQFLIDSYEGEDLKVRVVADGQTVWRYDPVANEYTFLPQDPSNVLRAVGTASAWMRTEMQRPMRLLMDSVRWLVRPEVLRTPPENPTMIQLWETRPVGQNDWRGSIVTFRFEEINGVKRMQGGGGIQPPALRIHDRTDVQGAVRDTQLTGEFFYIDDQEFTIEFTPPAGSRPAADLPKRGDG